MLAYEPEAAAVFCNHVTRDRMTANDPMHFVSDQPYIVADLGGMFSCMIRRSGYYLIEIINLILCFI